MSRPLRIEYPGAWYHVMNRGMARSDVFHADDQRERFLALLADTADRFNVEWHAYCLMENHYHLMVRTPEANLQRIMRHINGVYTQYFNRAEGRDGPLFRGRYKAILVDADAHWLELSRYIHRNPLEAGLVRNLSRYRWSSYPAYIGEKPPPDWLTTKYVLNAIGKRRLHERYKIYVAGDNEEDLRRFYEGGRVSAILGDDAFRRRALSRKKPDREIPELRRGRRLPGARKIIGAVARHLGIRRKEIMAKTRGRGVRSPGRSMAMYLCQQAGGMRLHEIAEAFDLSGYASAGATIRNFRNRLKEEPDLSQTVDKIVQELGG